MLIVRSKSRKASILTIAMDSIADLLSQAPKEPPQLQALREYVLSRHKARAQASVSNYGYTLTVQSAPLASTLRMETPKIKEYCALDKKLFIRIGHF